MNLQSVLEQACRNFSVNQALVDRGQTFTYGELFSLARAAATRIVELCGKADPRVAVMLGNRWEYIVLDMACAFAGFALVRVNARDGARELAHVLDDSSADCLIYGDEFRDTVAQALALRQGMRLQSLALPASDDGARHEAFVERLCQRGALAAPMLSPETPYRIMYTSGTTGLPKGVIVSHDQWCCAVLQNLFLGPVGDLQQSDCFLHVTPLTHVSGGLFWVFMARGARQVLCEDTTVEAIADAVSRYAVSHVFLVPTLVSKLVGASESQQAQLKALRRVYYAASPIAVPVLRRAIELYGPIFAQGYGSTEAMWWLTYFPPEAHERALQAGHLKRLASCGRPGLGIELQIVDEAGRRLGPGEIGEVATRGRHVARSYLNKGAVPRATEIGPDWFRLGDIGYVDDEGYFYLVDRKNNLMITGGFNVYPSEVEAVMAACPGTRDCCVFGTPDDHWGELITIVIVREPSSDLDADKVLAFAREHLPDYKRPRKVFFSADLPLNSGGKVDRRALREAFWAGHERRI